MITVLGLNDKEFLEFNLIPISSLASLLLVGAVPRYVNSEKILTIIYLWFYSPVESWPPFQFLNSIRSILGWGISPSQGRYIHSTSQTE
jgi:hypothetical protein